MSDIKLFYDENYKYYKIQLDGNGDFVQTDSFDTSIILSLFTDGRADKTQIAAPQNRRGWWGNAMSEDDVQFTSQLWLLDMARMTPATFNLANNTSKLALEWFVTKGYSKSIEVNTSANNSTINLAIKIKNENNALLFDGVYPLWQNTGT